MIELNDIKSGNLDLLDIIDQNLKTALSQTSVDLRFIDLNDPSIPAVNKLLKSIFPHNEFNDHAPHSLMDDETFCFILLIGDRVIGYVAASFDENDEELALYSLAIDKHYQGQKLGTLLMLSLLQIAQALDAKAISCISSGQGVEFYESFKFTAMAQNSFEAKLPLDETMLDKKMQDTISKLIQRKRKYTNSDLFPLKSDENQSPNLGRTSKVRKNR